MLLQIRQLQHKLSMGDGELMRLARETAQNATLVSLRDLTAAQRQQLHALLSALSAQGLEAEHFKMA